MAVAEQLCPQVAASPRVSTPVKKLVSQPIVSVTRELPGDPRALVDERVTLRLAGPGDMPRGELLTFIAGSHAVVCMFNQAVDAEFLDAAGPQLRAVCTFAVGTDNIDLELCRRRGVMVCNTPDAVTEGTANMAMALVLTVARRLVQADAFVRSGAFSAGGNDFPRGWMGMHLCGQTLHVVGAGRIGKAVAGRARAFGMNVVYTARSRHLDFEIAPLVARRVTLEEGLAMADVVSIHTPLTDQTRHLLHAGNLKLLKPTAIVINTSRGPVIDEAALAAHLKAGRIWGAGLDVFEHEPAVHPDLLTLDNVVLSPHIGSSERHYRELMTELVCTSASTAALGGEPANRVV